MSTMAFKLTRRRVRDLEEAADDVIVKHKEANLAQDVGDLVTEVLEVAESVKRLTVRHESGISPSTSACEIAMAHAAGVLVGCALRLVKRMISLATYFKRKGHGIDGIADLEIEQHQLTKLHESFSEKWMLPDEGRLTIARRNVVENKFRVLC